MELEELWDELRLGELSEGIRKLFPSASFSLEEMIGMLLEGRFLDLVQYLFFEGIGGLGINGQGLKSLLVSLLLLGVISATLTRFSELYEKYQVSELSFYLVYLLQAAMLARCFTRLSETSALCLERMVIFIKLLMPTYLFAVGMASGSITASAGYQMTMLLLYLVEEVLRKLFLPAATCLFLFAVLEGVMGQERMEYLTELLKKVSLWGLKGLLGAVAGLSFLQAVLAPAIDKVKASVLQKTIAAIPGVGGGAEGVLEIFLGSATVIKNSVGVLLTLLLLVFCLAPLGELLAFSITLKLAAAVMGIISEKRLTKAVDRTGDAGLLLLGITGTAMLFFLMVLAVATASVR